MEELVSEEIKIKINDERLIPIEPKENSLYFIEYRGRLQRVKEYKGHLWIPDEGKEKGYVIELKLNKTLLLAEYFPVYLSHEIAKDFGKLLNFNNLQGFASLLNSIKRAAKIC